ncbi:MAG: hypothetical protein HJJLKODD_02755 [Phycisphaerae bacterium]|nr:hypothetical protein [Phycisphaerae bacterium]
MKLSPSLKRTFLIILSVSLASSAVLGMLAITLSVRIHDGLLVSALFTSLYCLVGLACGLAMERSSRPWLAGFGIIATAVSYVMCMGTVWIDLLNNDEIFWQITGSLGVMGFAAGHYSLIALARLSANIRWIRMLTLLLIACSAIVVILIINGFKPFGYDGMEKIIFMMVILNLCGTVAVPILHFLNRLPAADQPPSVAYNMQIICPRCQCQQEVSNGTSYCQRCRLRFKIEFDEPRCDQCGYLLHQLTEPRCPECGWSFPDRLLATSAPETPN